MWINENGTALCVAHNPLPATKSSERKDHAKLSTDPVLSRASWCFRGSPSSTCSRSGSRCKLPGGGRPGRARPRARKVTPYPYQKRPNPRVRCFLSVSIARGQYLLGPRATELRLLAWHWTQTALFRPLPNARFVNYSNPSPQSLATPVRRCDEYGFVLRNT